MARISYTVCDLCKEKIKEDTSTFGIVLFSIALDYDNPGKKDKRKEENGEVCKNCHDALVKRLKKSPEKNLKFPDKPIVPNKPAQFVDCIGIQDNGVGQIFGKSSTGVLSVPPSDEAVTLADGEFKVPSKAHTVPRPPEKKCQHDKKSFGDDGKFICLLCNEVLGVV